MAILTSSRRKDNVVVPAKAGTHTPRPIGRAMGLVAFVTIDAGGYGSLLSQDDQKGGSPPCRAVLFVLRLDGVARLGPVGVRPVAQLIEVAAHRHRLDAVHRDGLAVDPVAAA